MLEVAWPTSTQPRFAPRSPKRKRPRPHQRQAIKDCVEGLAAERARPARDGLRHREDARRPASSPTGVGSEAGARARAVALAARADARASGRRRPVRLPRRLLRRDGREGRAGRGRAPRPRELGVPVTTDPTRIAALPAQARPGGERSSSRPTSRRRRSPRAEWPGPAVRSRDRRRGAPLRWAAGRGCSRPCSTRRRSRPASGCS